MKKTIPNKCTVLVVGGGPAGAMAAGLLAQDGIDVVVLEKEQFPRETVGESLIPHIWKYLDLIGASERIWNAGFIPKSGGSTLRENKFKKMSFSSLGYKRPGMHVERCEFDDILLKRAEELGAKVFFKTKVVKIIPKADLSQAIVKTEEGENQTINAKYIIDASGQSALLAKQEKVRIYDEGFRFHAFWGYFKGGNYLDGNAKIQPFEQRFKQRPMTFISNFKDWGWVWHIILREKTSIGIILPKKQLIDFKNRGATLSERFQSFVKDTPLTGRLMQDAKFIPDSVGSIKDYAYKPTQMTIGNCFLIGDACAFVDPINSVGIIIGMYGAFLATWSIKRALKSPSKIEGIKKNFETQLKLRLDLARLISFPNELVSQDMIEQGHRLIGQLDDIEKKLALTQIALTSRAGNLPEFIDPSLTSVHEEVELATILASAS